MTKTLRFAVLLLAGFVLSSCGWLTSVSITGVELSEGTITPAFDVAVTEYTATVPNATESVDVTVTSNNADLEVTINDVAVLPGSGTASVPLDVGENTVTIVVGVDEDSVTYTVVVTRLPSYSITGITLSEGTLTPAFDAATTDYTASVANATTSVDVSVTTDTPDLDVTIDGTPVLPGSGTKAVELSVGGNTVTIVVGDGADSVTYTVVVTRLGPPEIEVTGYASYYDEMESDLASGSPVDFEYAASPRTMSFTIKNTGPGPLTLTGTSPDYVTIENDDDPGYFSVSVQPTSDTIAPGEEETFSIVFNAESGFAAKSATVTISNDDEDESTFTLSLTGTLTSG